MIVSVTCSYHRNFCPNLPLCDAEFLKHSKRYFLILRAAGELNMVFVLETEVRSTTVLHLQTHISWLTRHGIRRSFSENDCAKVRFGLEIHGSICITNNAYIT